MKILIISFICISMAGLCKGYATDLPEHTVIAIGGLNMRDSPSTEGQVITSIPFLDKVILLDETSSVRDTLGMIGFEDHSKNMYAHYLLGDWVQVRYQHKEGYVFNAYLMEDETAGLMQSENDQYGITFAAANCVGNIHRNKQIKWKGVFKNGDGYKIGDVRLEYYMSPDEMMGDWFGTTTRGDDFPLFIIGTTGERFRNGAIEGTYFGFNKYFDYTHGSSTIENLTVHVRENGPFLTITEGNQQQNLDAIHGIQVIWKGDLDGDGKNDYIFKKGDKESKTQLYLSSEAGDGELVRLVAAYYSGFCC